MRSTRPPGPASPVWPPVSHVHGPAVTVPAPAVMARLRRFSLAAAQPASAGGAPPASQARGRAAAAARLRIPGGRHRRRRSRGDAAAYPPGPAMTGPPAMPGWDADQAVDVLYHAHYRSPHPAGCSPGDRRCRGRGNSPGRLRCHARRMAAPAGQREGPGLPAAESGHRRTIPPCSQPGPAQPRAGPAQAVQPAITAPQALLAALQALPARQREALVLRYYAGLPDTQIAAALGTSARAVTCHIGCGLSSLQAGQRGTEAGDRPL